jgi:hypothetical protein
VESHKSRSRHQRSRAISYLLSYSNAIAYWVFEFHISTGLRQISVICQELNKSPSAIVGQSKRSKYRNEAHSTIDRSRLRRPNLRYLLENLIFKKCETLNLQLWLGAPSEDRIYGGEIATAAKPYLVSIVVNEQHVCGGWIYNNDWIVTTAACVFE